MLQSAVEATKCSCIIVLENAIVVHQSTRKEYTVNQINENCKNDIYFIRYVCV